METVESKEDHSDQIGTCTELKPGQKYATPSPGSGDRVFYETLLQQNPNSEMAQDWCLMYGILEVDAATSLYKKVCKRKGKPITPIKTEVTSSSTSKKNDNDKVVPKSTKVTVPTGNKKAKIIDDVAVDTGLEASGAWESRGAIGV